MGSLWWHSNVRDLSDPEGATPLNVWRGAIKDGFVRNDFTDVRANDLEVAGGKDGAWLSVAHFNITGPRYWEVVMAGGGPDNKAVVDQAVRIIGGIVG